MATVVTFTTPSDPSGPAVVTVTGIPAGQMSIVLDRMVGTTASRFAGTFPVSGGTALIADYLYPLDTPFSYAVYGSDGQTFLASSAVGSPVLSGGYPWIRDVMYPSLRYASVTIVDDGSPVRAGRVTDYELVGVSLPVTAGDVRSGRRATLQLLAKDHKERDTIVFALSTGNPCQLRVPSECLFNVDEYLFTPTDVTETRIGKGPACVLSVDYIEVSPVQVPPFQAITYAVQTQNALAEGLVYGTLGPPATGLAANFVGKTYLDMTLSPTGIRP